MESSRSLHFAGTKIFYIHIHKDAGGYYYLQRDREKHKVFILALTIDYFRNSDKNVVPLYRD